MIDKIKHLQYILGSFIIITILFSTCLVFQLFQQANEIQLLREQVQENRDSMRHNTETNQRQEIVLNKLNAEYQMKHYKQEGKR